MLRGERPAILVEADATDPAATSNAIGSLRVLVTTALQQDLRGALAYMARGDDPIELRVHARYNPEAITQYNIVPGLMGVVLTMTMVMITGLAITRERERGTMENLLSMPTRPFEVMIGKVLPYILVGYIQVILILLAAHFLFSVPVTGNIPMLFVSALVFIVANLAMGITFSTLAQNQLQAMQLSFFFFCRLCCCQDLCSHFAVCRNGRNRSVRCCHSRTFCGLCGDHAEGQWSRGGGAPIMADRSVRGRGVDDWRQAISPDTGLTNGNTCVRFDPSIGLSASSQ